jgi:hypothetical protein
MRLPPDHMPSRSSQPRPRNCARNGVNQSGARSRIGVHGQISHTRAKLQQLIIDIGHVDAAIRIFDPNYDVDGIRQKISTPAHRALRGDLTRASLDALRDAPGPMRPRS